MHAATYNGPTSFTADYTIFLKPDNTLDPTQKSTVTFTTINYTHKEGKRRPRLERSDFKTLPITITGVTHDKDGKISFTFESNDWYPNAAGSNLVNNGLSGSIDLGTGAVSIKTSYISKNDGNAIYTYNVTGKVGAGGAGGGPGGGRPSALPEPATWMTMLAGIPGFVALAYRRRKRRPDTLREVDRSY